MSFLGESEHTLDKKNRLHLPRRVLAKFTEAEKQNLVLARAFDRCLGLYTAQAWTDFVSQFQSAGTPLDPEQRKFLRQLGRFACEVAVDGQGRILIPENLKAAVAIQEVVYVTGGIDTVEIWAREIWKEYFKEEGAEGSFERVGQALLDANRKCGGQTNHRGNLGGPV